MESDGARTASKNQRVDILAYVSDLAKVTSTQINIMEATTVLTVTAREKTADNEDSEPKLRTLRIQQKIRTERI